MSEYQYYEFQAIDRSLTMAEQQELRALSTRARVNAMVPSRIVLEFDDASPSGIMLSDHAARSKT
jgi:hypothetical protein